MEARRILRSGSMQDDWIVVLVSLLDGNPLVYAWEARRGFLRGEYVRLKRRVWMAAWSIDGFLLAEETVRNSLKWD